MKTTIWLMIFISVRISLFGQQIETTTNTSKDSPATTINFTFTGSLQTWTVPAGVYNVRIETWGAQGNAGNASGGLGGYAAGNLSVSPGQLLYIYVGGQNGYNGGGSGGLSQNGTYGGNGGGASDVRTGGTAYNNRVIVAGGGGGGGRDGSYVNCQPSPAGAGGSGGGTAGANGYSSACNCGGGGTGGGAGTSSSGGAAGTHSGGCTRDTWCSGTAGSSGSGGSGSTCIYQSGSGGAGGGGGGFFGGGAGGNGSDTTPGGGGGGGSSSTEGLSNTSVSTGTQTGNGQVAITVLSLPVISTSGTFTAFSNCSGSVSSSQYITAEGSNLSTDIIVTAPSGFELSTTSGGSFSNSLTLTQSGGTVSSTTIYCRITTSASGSPSGNISLASTGATTQNVAVSGTVDTPPTVNAGEDQTISATSVTLDGSISGSASTGSWSGGTGTYNPNSSTLSATYTPSAAERLIGSVTLTLTSADPDGPCGSVSDNVILTVTSADKISIVDGYWETADNWSPAGVPTLIDNVTINHDITVHSSQAANPAFCYNLNLNSGKLLTIESGKALTVNGTLSSSANATLTVVSGGSLITAGSISNSGTVNIQRTITKDRWHLISSPVTNATAGVFDGDYLQSWSEVNAEWTDIISPAATLETAQGYGLWTTQLTDHTYTFNGTPNTGNQNISLTVSNNFPEPETGNDGANLLGNPYPSAIDWSLLDDTYGAVYYWQGNGTDGEGTYLSWINGTGPANGQYIAPMQGFFIVTNNAGTFSLINAHRTHIMGSYYKSETETKENLLVLETESKGISDKLYVNFNPEATEDFDLQHDAYKFASGTAGLSELYSYTAGDKKLSIDVRPACEVVQLGFTNSLSGEYTIKTNLVNGITNATLEDTKLATFTDVLAKPYTFSYTAGEPDNRFKLHFSALSVEDKEVSNISIYSYQNTAYINLNNRLKGNIYIYNLAGQLITAKESITGQQGINLSASGVYVVRVVTDKETVTCKVVIR